jgi:hypothetical protein
MRRTIATSGSFEEEERKQQEAFYNLPDNEKVKAAFEISQILLSIQYENKILPEDDNFTLTR